MNRSGEKHLQRFIRQVTTAAANASLYHLQHPQVLQLCQQALQDLLVLQAEHPLVSLKIIDNQLIYADQPVQPNLSVERWIEAFSLRGISHLRLERGVSIEDLLGLVNTLSKRPEQSSQPNSGEHIHYSRVEIRYQKSDQTAAACNLSQFAELPDHGLDKLKDIYRTVRNKKQLNVVGLAEIVSSFVTSFGNHGEVFMALAPLRSMDEYTYTHSTNICLLNLAQARLLGIEGPLLNEIGIAAMLHDVGKMFIPTEILNKKGKLESEEWELMQQHPQLGAEYLFATPGVPRLAAITAYEHHMRFDGQGYPHTKGDWHLNACSYLTAISDCYDALRTRRAYEEPLPFGQICSIMLDNAGSSLHPELTKSFLIAMGKLEKNNG